MRSPRLFKHLPTSAALRNNRFLKPFNRYLDHHFLWQFNRRAVAGGVAIGLFFGFMIPFAQILFAAIGAIIFRVNLPVAAFSTLVTNPLTFPPIYYFAYKLGGFITGSTDTDTAPLPGEAEELVAQQTEVIGLFANLVEWAQGVGLPLITGLTVLAVVSAVTEYFLVSGLWRLQAIRRWRKRGRRRPLLLNVSGDGPVIKITRDRALVIGLLSFIGVAAVDVGIEPQISLLLLQLIPVLFVTWFAGPRWGMLFAIALTTNQVIMRVLVDEQPPMDVYGMIDIGSDLIAIVLLVWLQSKLRDAFEQVEKLARHDPLTGILNRKGFYEALHAETERRKRYGHPISLIYFDCDHFKQVNDTLGHDTGDSLLVRIAHTLHTNLRSVDASARLGGDEFAVMLPETSADAVKNTVTHLKTKLDAEMRANKWPVSFSMGAATFINAPGSVEEALACADSLMYEAKHGGRDAIIFKTF
ncbi:MAG TPA: DUF2062 domain-containing protein [Noviherbaspirillum sp.]|jgi:hypothetical protein|uniref:DUF2062 domain-containing protein n=1 Tax=Noviherbaspirillum sp. TaxID=1926288 RepID=UPI002DDD0DF6|nr:DUF2062 domain-containing protein [Noviherbaspirillum sp.]HEV2609480.1 DUF2062 domain-containing protein [Noviherbaspirillum sp.]